MSVRMIRAKIRPDAIPELEKTVTEMFAAIEAAQPQGVRYASLKLPDEETYLILVGLEDDANNALETVPEFRAFQENIRSWVAAPPTLDMLTIVGSYRFF